MGFEDWKVMKIENGESCKLRLSKNIEIKSKEY